MNKKFGTELIHGNVHTKYAHGSLVTPIYQTSTFVFDSAEQGGRRFAGEESGYIYTRLGNPTVTHLEEKVALLEKGEACAATGSGMGAISTALWSALKAGDHVVADETLYGCTFALLSHGLTRFGVDVTFVDSSNLENVKKALKPNTKVVYLETPANPNLKIVDIEKISFIAHEFNKDIKVMVDNTFATPYLQTPLILGADVVLHSATKYLNGHGDVIAGFIIGKEDFITECKLFGIKDMTGSVLSPFDAYLTIRGLKTLEVRMKKHVENAKKVVEFLNEHEAIEKVYYPGLKSHEGHELAKKQMYDFGAMISFEIKGGKGSGIKLLNNLRVCTLAVSLGDIETLIQHPASMTHSAYTEQELEEAGISQGLVRISVGLEDAQDIIQDLKNSLDELI